MKRTTKNELFYAVRVLNEMIGAVPGTPGSFFLQGAYGGWQLQKIVGTDTALLGTTAIFDGYRSKRELLDLIYAFRAGIRAGQESASIPKTT
jgi:hypothetical protein